MPTALSRRVNVYGVLLCLCVSRAALAGLVADPDPYAAGMIMAPAPIADAQVYDAVPYFSRPIPRHIHQVWFGRRTPWLTPKPLKERERTSHWQRYAAQFNYRYSLWTDQDVAHIAARMPPALQAQFQYAIYHGIYHVAADLARLTLIAHYGGIYVDSDMQPPNVNGEDIDLATFLPQEGLVLTTERHARSVGSPSLMVANGFMMACPNHPVLAHLMATLGAHMLGWMSRNGRANGMYATGCIPLSRSLAGALSLIDLDTLYALGVIDEDSPNWVLRPPTPSP